MDHEGASGGGKKLLYVGGLAEEVDEKTLQAAFIPFGDIVEVNLLAGSNLQNIHPCLWMKRVFNQVWAKLFVKIEFILISVL